MNRRHIWIDTTEPLAATIDAPDTPPPAALLIVSGGNELRAGAFAGQARLAAALAAAGFAVMRFDAPGIGDSPGVNGGFAARGPALAAAAAALRAHIGERPLLLFGNCDAASLIALDGAGIGAAGWLLANPWVIEGAAADTADTANGATPAPPSAAAIRARYLARLANPGALIRDLFRGQIALGKLASGLRRLSAGDAPSALADRIGAALAAAPCPVTILLARRDTTARAFAAAWRGPAFAAARARADIELAEIDSASHSFADDAARGWLSAQITGALAAAAAASGGTASVDG